MKKIWHASTVLAVSLLLILSFFVPCSFAGPSIVSYDATGNPPTIDGDPGEWSGSTPSIELNTPANPDANYPVPTFVYFKNDSTYLYVLVDVIGDLSNGLACDECLLEFNLSPTTDIEVGWRDGALVTDPDPLPAGSQVSIAFAASFNTATPHRIYELRIPLRYFGAWPGKNVYFSSPSIKGVCMFASIPYDGGDGTSFARDNVYPYGLNQLEPGTFAQLQLNGTSIPTYTEWGMIIFILFAGAGAVYYLRRQRRAEK